MSNKERFVCIATCIDIDEVPDDFEPIESDIDLADKYPIGLKDSFIYLANLYKDKKRLYKLKSLVESWFVDIDTAFDHISELKSNISSVIDESHIDFFLSVILGRIAEAKRGMEITDGIFMCLETACEIAEKYAEALCDPDGLTPSGSTHKESIISVLSVASKMGLAFDCEYRPVLGFCRGQFTFLNTLLLTDALSVVNLAAINIIKENTVIRRCCNCGDYFIPSSRSDEIYCNKLLPSGKTCKTIGYDERIKSNEILREYRKIYKTQNARKQRNAHKANITENFRYWTTFAKDILIKCQNGEITLDEMISKISTDDWMHMEK